MATFTDNLAQTFDRPTGAEFTAPVQPQSAEVEPVQNNVVQMFDRDPAQVQAETDAAMSLAQGASDVFRVPQQEAQTVQTETIAPVEFIYDEHSAHAEIINAGKAVDTVRQALLNEALAA
jgi:hypothetical protein